MEEILKISNLSVNYGTEIDTLRNISFTLKQGETIGIIGESGSGKSTIARVIMNLLPKKTALSTGQINYKGSCLNQLTERQWCNIRGREIAIIFQNPSLYLNPILKIKKQFIETLICNDRKISKKGALEIAKKQLEKMNLTHIDKILNSYPFELSGGMLQRVMIAMVIALKPKLIIADEPTSSLDIVTQGIIIKELLRLKNKYRTSLIFITHDLSLASQISDKIMVIKNGLIIEVGSTKDVLHHPKTDYTKQLLDSVYTLDDLQSEASIS